MSDIRIKMLCLKGCRRCQILVGTLGRVGKLVEMGALVAHNCRILVLDEADHLLSDSFVKGVRRAPS